MAATIKALDVQGGTLKSGAFLVANSINDKSTTQIWSLDKPQGETMISDVTKTWCLTRVEKVAKKNYPS